MVKRTYAGGDRMPLKRGVFYLAGGRGNRKNPKLEYRKMKQAQMANLKRTKRERWIPLSRECQKRRMPHPPEGFVMTGGMKPHPLPGILHPLEAASRMMNRGEKVCPLFQGGGIRRNRWRCANLSLATMADMDRTYRMGWMKSKPGTAMV
jgi:hypothetical protein